jgi:class 3 adenylate cyclase
VAEEIEEFLTGAHKGRAPARSLKTLVFTDIVGSTERARERGDERWRQLLDRQDAAAHRQITRFDGRFVKSTGDGALDEPSAIRKCLFRSVRLVAPAYEERISPVMARPAFRGPR